MPKRTKLLICIIFTVLAAGALCFLFLPKTTTPNITNDEPISTIEGTVEQSTKPLSISELIDSVKSIKNMLMSSLNDIKNNNIDGAKIKLQAIPQHIQGIRSSVNHTVTKFNGSVPFLQNQINTIMKVLDAADIAIENIMLPAVDLLQAHPISEMHVDDGINTHQLCLYIDFIDSIIPDIEHLMACANSIDLSLIDTDGKISGYLQTANDLLDVYHADTAILSKIKSMLGAESDRLYLIAAQNSTEIRASGGFPGSIGVIRIQDGLLTLGEFESVYNVLAANSPSHVRLTPEEYKLFNYLSGMLAPRDADLCPDFERVAYIWANGYEARNHEPIDGVISMTPHIVERLLKAANQEITLSDGSILNGENATHVLQYDLYFKYFSKGSAPNGDTVSDQLFAEAAQLTMDTLISNLSVSQMLDYFTVAKDSFADRTLMVWMKNEEEQALISQMGWHGGLNTDPEKPQAGIYYNCTIPSKMGWFLLIDTQLGERVLNEDGSYSYPVTVQFSNNITQEELNVAKAYITGNYGGAIQGSAYFFAPAGGSISNFSADKKITIQTETYHNLDLGFIRQFQVKAGETVTVTYTITTAPGVETPLTFSKTPTAQQS